MLIPDSYRKYFLTPMQDPFATSDKVFVFRERTQRGLYIDKITEVKGRSMYDYHLWWTTTGGDYVDGAAVSPLNLPTYQPMMGIIGENLFVIGTGVGVDSQGRMKIESARRSDGVRIASGNGRWVDTYYVRTWLQAAPWARDMMPAEGDTSSTVSQKLSIAKQKFETALAEVCILRESQARSWEDDLEDLDYSLPKPTYALHVDGTVFVATGQQVEVDALTEDRQAMIRKARENSIGGGYAPARMETQIPVPASFLVRTSITDLDDVKDVSEYTIVNAARERLDIPVMSVVRGSTIPFIRSLIPAS